MKTIEDILKHAAKKREIENRRHVEAIDKIEEEKCDAIVNSESSLAKGTYIYSSDGSCLGRIENYVVQNDELHYWVRSSGGGYFRYNRQQFVLKDDLIKSLESKLKKLKK